MDYEKKYNEALERAKKVKHDIENIGCSMAPDMLEVIFPELEENEDERIRKVMLEHFKSKTKETWCGLRVVDILAYLEKQKEQKPVDLSEMMVHKEPYIAPVPTPIVADEQKQVEPTGKLSREDYLHQLLIDQLITYSDYEYLTGKKPAEWSEEDEDMLNSCISSIEEAKENRYAYKETDGDTSYDHEIAWLKSLRPVSKESLQPHWKPSEEQMEVVLENEIDDYIKGCLGSLTGREIASCARYFYELGFNAKKSND